MAPTRFQLRRGRLVLFAVSFSIEHLIVGFALGAYTVPVLLAVTVIAVISVALSLIGWELGDALGGRSSTIASYSPGSC